MKLKKVYLLLLNMNDFTYLDELVLYEHGKYNISKYKEWITEWGKWLDE